MSYIDQIRGAVRPILYGKMAGKYNPTLAQVMEMQEAAGEDGHALNALFFQAGFKAGREYQMEIMQTDAGQRKQK